MNFPPTSRTFDNAATPKQGPIGRAVRKLTPRKSSLVNLLKGKGWNKSEETKQSSGVDTGLQFDGSRDEPSVTSEDGLL